MKRWEGLELMDEPGFPESARAAANAGIEKLSRLTGMEAQVISALRRLLPAKRASLVEIGAGSGWLSRRLEAEFPQASIRATDLKAGPGVSRLDCLDSRSLPKPDYFFSSLMLHHLGADELAKALALQASRARRGFLHFDLERSALHLIGAFPLLWLMPGIERVNRVDGLLSIRRAWTAQELLSLAPRGAQVRRVWPFRLVLTWQR